MREGIPPVDYEWYYRCKRFSGAEQNGVAIGYSYDAINRILREGEWKDGKLNGMGREAHLCHAKPQTYIGRFKAGLLDGYGILLYDALGHVPYQGEWKAGMYHGKGLLFNRAGTYEGDFVEGRRSGIGSMSFANDKIALFDTVTETLVNSDDEGSTYEGGKHSSRPHSLTHSLTHSHTLTHTKGWLNDRHDGFGILRTKDSVYEGNWTTRVKEGEGNLVDLKQKRTTFGTCRKASFRAKE